MTNAYRLAVLVALAALAAHGSDNAGGPLGYGMYHAQLPSGTLDLLLVPDSSPDGLTANAVVRCSRTTAMEPPRNEAGAFSGAMFDLSIAPPSACAGAYHLALRKEARATNITVIKRACDFGGSRNALLGAFSSVVESAETGDLIGEEFIFAESSKGLFVVYIDAEGSVLPPKIAAVSVVQGRIHFDLEGEVFEGAVEKNRLVGRFNARRISIARRPSAWAADCRR